MAVAMRQFISGSSALKINTGRDSSTGKFVLSGRNESKQEHSTDVLANTADQTSQGDCYLMSITTLAPRYSLLRELSVLVEPSGSSFTASFYEANIHSSGSSIGDALDSLKDLIIDAYEMLSGMQASQLGPEPRKQLAILEAVIRPKA